MAAPVAVVGYLSYEAPAPTLFLSNLPATPAIYRVRITATTSDGLTDHPYQQQTGEVLLGPTNLNDVSQLPFASTLGGISWGSDGVSLELSPLPPIVSPIIGVDPIAERSLLGPSASFLDPLSKVALDERRTDTFPTSSITDQFAFSSLDIETSATSPLAKTKRAVVPLIVSNRLYSSLNIEATIDRLGDPLEKYPSLSDPWGEAAATHKSLTRIGEASLDAGRILRPFQAPSLTLLWPGSQEQNGEARVTGRVPGFQTKLSQRPQYDQESQASNASSLRLRVTPAGILDAYGRAAAGLDPSSSDLEVGSDQSYRVLANAPLAAAQDFSPQYTRDRPFFLAPLGEFDLSKLHLPTNPLNYVPLGAYDPPSTTVLASGKSLVPTLYPAGLTTGPPLAVTDLLGAQTLRGLKPIDAVRVRVSGLAHYDENGRRFVERIASQIANMGFDVDIVAGSSPRPVDIYVPAYDVSSAPPADLGWVRQTWTSIGAAQHVERAVSNTNQLLFLLSLLIVITLAAALEMVRQEIRAQEIGILKAVGWNRFLIARWALSESLVIGLLLVMVSTIVWWAAHGAIESLAVSVVIGLALPAASLCGFLVSSRRVLIVALQGAQTRSPLVFPQATSALTIALRQNLLYWPRAVALVSAASVAGAAGATGIAAVFVSGAAGPSLLATFITHALAVNQLGILGLIIVTGVLVVTLTWELEERSNRRDAPVLTACGWRQRQIVAIIRWRLLLIAFAACAISALLQVLVISPALALPQWLTAFMAPALVCVVLIPVFAGSFRSPAKIMKGLPWG